jgi:hypothetical protein
VDSTFLWSDVVAFCCVLGVPKRSVLLLFHLNIYVNQLLYVVNHFNYFPLAGNLNGCSPIVYLSFCLLLQYDVYCKRDWRSINFVKLSISKLGVILYQKEKYDHF